MKKGSIQGVICFKLVLRLLVPLPLSKVALMLLFHVAHLFSKMELLVEIFMCIVGSNHPLQSAESSYIVGLPVGCWPSPYPLDRRPMPTICYFDGTIKWQVLKIKTNCNGIEMWVWHVNVSSVHFYQFLSRCSKNNGWVGPWNRPIPTWTGCAHCQAERPRE